MEGDTSEINKNQPKKNPSRKSSKMKRKTMKTNRKFSEPGINVHLKTFSKFLLFDRVSSIKAKEIDWRRKNRGLTNCFIIGLVFLLETNASVAGNVPIMSTRIVETRYGKLQGMIYPMDHAKHLKPVEVFLGVPYATPPIRSNRFSPTRTPSPWEGVRIADKMGPVCPQKLPGESSTPQWLRSAF